MNRPAPRKSTLAGTSPLTPSTPIAPPAEEPAAAPTTPAAAPAATTAPKPRRAGTKTTAEKYPRLNYYVDSPEEAGRIRAAFLAGRAHHGWRTFSDMQRDSVLAVVEQLERELNGGAPFTPATAGSVPSGRAVE